MTLFHKLLTQVRRSQFFPQSYMNKFVLPLQDECIIKILISKIAISLVKEKFSG
jgi:hypothetical protein